MSIIVGCKCGRKFRARDEHAGKRAKCPACGHPLVIGASSHVEPPESPPTAAASSVTRRGGDTRTARPWRWVVLGGSAILVGVLGAVGLYHLVSARGTPANRSGLHTGQFTEATEAAEAALVEEAEHWPFKAEMPQGFEFSGKQEWKGRILWVLKGKPFGNARETLTVIQTTEEAFADDVRSASVWAAELCVGVSLGSSPASSFEFDRMNYEMRIIEPHSPNEQSLFSPEVRKKQASREFPGSIDLAWPELTLAHLGRRADFAPSPLSAIVGPLKGTVLLVAWAGKAKDSEAGQGALVGLCRGLREETPKRAKSVAAPQREGAPFASAIPAGYTFDQRRRHGGVTLWIYRGRDISGVQETLLVADWKERTAIFVPQVSCARWAAELALGRPLSEKAQKFDLDNMTILTREGPGRYKMTRPWEARKTGEKTEFTISGKDLLALGERSQSIPRLAFTDAAASEQDVPVYVSAVSRAVESRKKDRWLAVAGATVSATAEFWRIVRMVDDTMSACITEAKTSAQP